MPSLTDDCTRSVKIERRWSILLSRCESRSCEPVSRPKPIRIPDVRITVTPSLTYSGTRLGFLPLPLLSAIHVPTDCSCLCRYRLDGRRLALGRLWHRRVLDALPLPAPALGAARPVIGPPVRTEPQCHTTMHRIGGEHGVGASPLTGLSE